MIIREVNKNDFEQVLNIENSCFIDPYPVDHMEYEFNKNPLNKILVVEEDGKIIGFIDYMITFNSATITQIAVLPNYRKMGIGFRLLKEMENTFPKEIDDIVENVTLEVRKSNLAAINLYKKDGYEEIVIKKNYYKNGEDAIYMVKRLLLCR